jgi:hypothetical protein
MSDISELIGKTLTDVKVDDQDDIGHGNRMTFVVDDGSRYLLHHYQSCCEHVYIESVVGDVDDLVGTPILEASERSDSGSDNDYESYTWTFYTIRTIKGTVDVRWHGTSNGYYSESVDFEKELA